MIKKYILLISLLLPFPALSHDWNQLYWLETIMRNHIKVGSCLNMVYNQDMENFREQCSLWSMGYTENRLMDEYFAARLVHPDSSDKEFFEQHFSQNLSPVQILAIRTSVIGIADRINIAIITMHLAEGLTRK